MSVTMMAPRPVVRQVEKAEGVRTQWQVVTPELATKWLEGNTHNRPVRDSVVLRYAADMKAGRWKQTHQGIAMDENGTLIDGQHRLFAVIEAGVPVLMQVTYNLPMDAQTVVDDNVRRSVVDVLKINGYGSISALHASTARRMRIGMSNSEDVRQATRQDEGEFLIRHWDAIHFAVSFCPPSKRVKGVTSAGTLGAVARAYYHEDVAKLTRFMQVLISGITERESENVIILLRNWLMTRPFAGSSAGAEVYAKTQRVIIAFVRGLPLPGNKIYAVTEDEYPIPVRNGGKLR